LTRAESTQDASKLFKKGNSSKKPDTATIRCLKQISKKFPSWFFHPVKSSSELDAAFRAIDSIRTQGCKLLQLAILYSDPTTTDIERLVKKKPTTPDYDTFLKALAIPPLVDGKSTAVFQDIQIEWMVGTEMKKQAIRSFIGNSQCLIIFHDSETPFDPSNLFLGQVTNFVCVVSPYKQKQSSSQWTVAFFVHFETKLQKASQSDLTEQTQQQEDLILTKLCDFQPKIPSAHIFEIEELLGFIVTKCYNSKMNFMKFHPTVKRMFELPVGNSLRDICKNFASDWFYSQVGKKCVPGIN